MIFHNLSEMKERIELHTGQAPQGEVTVTDDTSDYLDIIRGMVLRLEGNDYLVTGNAREGRFGLHEQPKFWVKYAVDLSNGKRKIIKLVFHEEFTSRIGRFLVKNVRSPEKESRILDLVRGHPNFMQGQTVLDGKENVVRILDFIQGPTIFERIMEIRQSHEEYLFHSFPAILTSIIACVEAMDFLNRSGEHHGDIRNDHILIDAKNGIHRWIDFDYSVNYPDYDLWSMGNIITYAVGKGIHAVQRVRGEPSLYPLRSAHITTEDTLAFYRYRVANLKKLFPYIPRKLNEILLRFSFGTETPYEDFSSQIEDLREVLSFFPTPAKG